MRRMNITSGTIILLCAISLSAAADEYKVVMSRPSKIGDKYDITSEGYELNRITATINGEIADNTSEKTGLEFQGSIHVINVDSNKTPSKVNMIIEKLIQIQNTSKTPFIQNEVKTPLLAKGTVVTVSVIDDKDIFLVDDSPVSDEARKLLSMVIAMGKNEPTDDEVFGSKVPRKIGDRWDIDRDKAAIGLLDKEEKIDVNDIEGSSTLKDVETIDGIKCLNINSQIRIKNIKPPMSPGIDVKVATFKANFTGKFPLDLSIDVLEDHEEMTTNIIAENQAKTGSRAMTIETTIKQVMTTKYSYKN